jgi:hypothetical protein
MTPPELMAFAARLRARADSVVMRDQPEQQRDLRTAASLVNRLAHVHVEIRRVAGASEDEAAKRRLCELLGGIDDIPAFATPNIISESPTHVVIAIEIAKATLFAHRRLFDQLIVFADDRKGPR